MELQINLEYRIKTDPLNIILEKRRIAKKGASEGKEVWETVGSYPDIEWAYRSMVKKEGINKEDLAGVQAIVAAIERSTEAIKESLSESNIRILEKQLRKLAMENELLEKQLNKKGEGESAEK